MWNRWHIYALFLFTGCIISLIPCPVQAGSDECYKEVTDSAAIGTNRVVNIHSIKGNLKITCWDRQEVWVKTRIAFKNEDSRIAREELEYARFNFLKTVSGINISNYFSLPRGIEAIQSIVTVDYQVYLPNNVTVVINNEYGSCAIDNLDAYVNLNNKYGDIILNEVKGRFRVFASLCDIQMKGFTGNFELYSSNSEIFLKDINGLVKVENKVGTIVLEPGEELDYLDVNSTHSKINLVISDPSRFNYELIAENAEVELDPAFRHFRWQIRSTEKMVYHSRGIYRGIDIITTHNSIKLSQDDKNY
jgi:hypothetical protein